LGHILQPYDGGAFIKELLEGDIHTKNQKDMGLETRAQSKRAIYCLIYGGGDARLGEAVGGTAEDGKKLKKKFFKNNPAFKILREKVMAKAKTGFLKGIDGRLLPCRADYISLNLILQATASLIMKQATVFLHKALEEKGYVWGEDYYQVAHIHDEVQLIAKENIADEVGQIAVQSIRHTTEHFKFRCPLEGEYKVGNNWSQTH
jgi:DNA polymerase-1